MLVMLVTMVALMIGDRPHQIIQTRVVPDVVPVDNEHTVNELMDKELMDNGHVDKALMDNGHVDKEHVDDSYIL